MCTAALQLSASVATTHLPWLAQANYDILRFVFAHLPHSGLRDTIAEFLAQNSLVSTWVFAAVFYALWIPDDERSQWRRLQLTNIMLAFVIAVVASFVVRPWIHWPAPVRSSGFQPLYPQYFWGLGSSNSFPSHSSLVYFVVSLGLWPLNRRLSVLLTALVLVGVSFPRVYVGGHYPIDVLGSAVLAVGGLAAARHWGRRVSQTVSQWLAQPAAAPSYRHVVLFFWMFELASNFRASGSVIRAIRGFAKVLGWRL